MRLTSTLICAVALAVSLGGRPCAADSFSDFRSVILSPDTTAALKTPFATQRLLLQLVTAAQAARAAGRVDLAQAILQAAIDAVNTPGHGVGQPGPQSIRTATPRARFFADPASEATAQALLALLVALKAEATA